MVVAMRNFAILSILAFGLTGCAFPDMSLDMPINGLNKPISGGNNREVIVVVPFHDDRTTKDRCGMNKNALNMDVMDVICKTAPEKWIAQLLADELRVSGFKVLNTSDSHGQGTLKIEGSVLRVFGEIVIGLWSSSLETDLKVKLSATTENGLHAERTFFAKGLKKGVIVATGTPYHTSLKRATNELLTEMVESIFYLMNKYPQKGLPDVRTQPIETPDSAGWR